MKNGEALDRVRDNLTKMLDDAYVLPDGRRVFKTDDGRHVFDENGAELSSETIDPQAIEGRHFSWERYKAVKDVGSQLQTKRHALFEFQAKLDNARDRVGMGDISKKDLDDLGANLAASAPPSVRHKLDASTTDMRTADGVQPGGIVPLSGPAKGPDDRRVAPTPMPM